MPLSLKKTVLIGIGVAITIIGIFIISEFKNAEEPASNTMTNFENFKPMTFSVLNVTVADAKNLHEKVCPRPVTFRPTYIPEQINFVYLKPKYPIFRIACEYGPPGISHEYYAISENNEVIPLNKDTFQIENPWQVI